MNNLTLTLRFLSCLFAAAFPAAAAQDIELTFGSVVTGQLKQPGDLDQYKFTGHPGQRLIYDAMDFDSASINLRLISPSGVVLLERNSRSDVEPFTLLESGTYTLVLDGNGAAVGNYTFRVLDMASQPVLGLDAVLTMNLNPGTAADAYQFNGTLGQRLFFDGLGAASGATWHLYAPNNQALMSAGIGNDFEVTLLQAGTYLVVVWGNNPTPAQYSVQVGSFNIGTNALTFGLPVSGTLAKPGEQAAYTFTGEPGQHLLYDALDTDAVTINMRLISPAGVVILERNSRSDVEPFTLAESGAYTLVIDGIGSAVGNYTFRVLNLAAQPTLDLDTVLTRNIDPGSSVDAYQFNGTVGERLFFDGLGANVGASWYLYAPNNTALGSAGIGSDFEITLNQSGSFYVVVWGTAATPISYSVEVVTSEEPESALTFGASVSGAIAQPGDQHLYTFNGTAGQKIYYDSLDRDFEQIYCRLIAPSSGFVWDFAPQSNDVGPVTLLEDGTYTLLIDGLAAATGDYSFRLLDLAAASALSMTIPTSGQLNPSSATEAYQLNGTAGQRVNLDSISATTAQANWRLMSPADQAIASASINSDLGDAILPLTGPYWLLVEGTADSLAPLSFQFAATDHSDTPVPASGLGEVKTGNIAADQQITNSFAGPAGLWVYFDSQDRTSTSLITELRDPSGSVVFSVPASNDAGPYLLPRSGSYSLVVRGANSTVTGSYRFRLMDWTGGVPHLTLNGSLTGNLDPGFLTEVFRFAGQPGQRLVYDALENDFSNVTVRLVTPAGQVRFLNGNADTDVGPFTLTAVGTYYLVFESNLSTPATYKAQLLAIGDQPELSFGTQVDQTLDPGLSIAMFRFPGAPGQRLFYDGFASNPGGVWYVFGPNNQNLGGAGLNGDFEVVAPQAGEYILMLSGNGAAAQPASFGAYLAEVLNPTPRPKITSILASSGTASIVWQAEPGKVYRLQHKGSLEASWSDLAGDVTAAGPSATKTDSSIGTAVQRFYRVVLLP